MSTLGTGTLGSGTLGNPGTATEPELSGGGMGPRRLTREQILRLREDEDALIFAALT